MGPGRVGNGGDGRQGGGVQSSTNGEGLARCFAVVEQIRLIAGRIRSDRRQGMPLGEAGFAGFDEIEVRTGRSDISSPEVIVNHDPGLGQVTHHGHVTALALVGPGRSLFLRNDLGGVDIQGVGPASEFTQPMGDDPAIHPV